MRKSRTLRWLLCALALASSTLVAIPGSATAATAGSAQASSSCRHAYSGYELWRLIELSDPATLRDLYDAQDRATEIRAIFTRYGDYRGTFAIFYKAVLDGAIPTIERGDYEDPEYVTAVSFDFFYRYLENLHWHLTGGPVTEFWRNFYDKTAQCELSPGRVLLAALNAHVIIDLPQAVATVGSQPRHFADFMRVGDSLQEVTPVMFADFEDVYGQDVSDFFGGLIFGDAFDAVAGQGATQYTVLQSARVYAFDNGLELQTPAAPAVFERMRASWVAAEAVVDTSAAVGVL